MIKLSTTIYFNFNCQILYFCLVCHVEELKYKLYQTSMMYVKKLIFVLKMKFASILIKIKVDTSALRINRNIKRKKVSFNIKSFL